MLVDRAEVGGGGAPALGDDFEAQPLPFGESGHPGTLHGGDVDEDVLAAVVGLDEAESLRGVEPLHGTSVGRAHLVSSFEVQPPLERRVPQREAHLFNTI